MFHSDQGCRVHGGRLPGGLRPDGRRPVDGQGGSALDNAAIESWHTMVEFELRALEHFPTGAAARTAVAAWIENYSHDRRYSSIGMQSPVAYETALRRQHGQDAA